MNGQVIAHTFGVNDFIKWNFVNNISFAQVEKFFACSRALKVICLFAENNKENVSVVTIKI